MQPATNTPPCPLHPPLHPTTAPPNGYREPQPASSPPPPRTTTTTCTNGTAPWCCCCCERTPPFLRHFPVLGSLLYCMCPTSSAGGNILYCSAHSLFSCATANEIGSCRQQHQLCNGWMDVGLVSRCVVTDVYVQYSVCIVRLLPASLFHWKWDYFLPPLGRLMCGVVLYLCVFSMGGCGGGEGIWTTE